MDAKSHKDRALIARFIEREMKGRAEIRGNLSKMARMAGVSPGALRRALAGDSTSSTRTYAGIENGLGLPTDSLLLIGAHDWSGLIDEGMDPMQVDWIRREATKSVENVAKTAGGS